MLLDDLDIDAWPSFFTETRRYVVTTRETVQADQPIGIINCVNRGMMQDRVKAFHTANIFETHVYNHMLGPAEILEQSADQCRVRSNFQVVRNQSTHAEETIMSSEPRFRRHATDGFRDVEGLSPRGYWPPAITALHSRLNGNPNGSVGRDDPLKTNERRQPVRILVVDDDPGIRATIVNCLEDHNMRAVGASGRQEMARQLTDGDPSLVLLDLRFGQDSGLDLLRDIRSDSDVPVIIITGDRRDEIDRVVGLELGADDYLTKPFGLRELLARVRAVLRRETRRAALRDQACGRCRFGGWQLDRHSRRLANPGGAPVALTKSEYAVLIAFLDAPQRPLTREHLLQATRVHEDVFDRSIDVQILRLRRKLEVDPSAPRIIQTERGVGYVFALAVEPA